MPTANTFPDQLASMLHKLEFGNPEADGLCHGRLKRGD